MSIKRFHVLGTASVFACVFAMLGAAVSTSDICACGTLNGSIASSLHELDGIIQQYGMDHQGLSPTYSELHELVSSDPRLGQMLTPDVNFTSQAFTFDITRADAGRMGYAVSSDRRDHILLGIGMEVREIRFFGWEPIPPVYKMQIWRFGEIAPVDEFVID
jgi:hypothetical protein